MPTKPFAEQFIRSALIQTTKALSSREIAERINRKEATVALAIAKMRIRGEVYIAAWEERPGAKPAAAYRLGGADDMPRPDQTQRRREASARHKDKYRALMALRGREYRTYKRVKPLILEALKAKNSLSAASIIEMTGLEKKQVQNAIHGMKRRGELEVVDAEPSYSNGIYTGESAIYALTEKAK